MLINETITAAMDATMAKQTRVSRLDEIIRRPWQPDEHSTAGEIEAAAAELAALNIEIKIDRDNLRRMIYAEALPIALDILRKYNGKPYGEKTKEKISAEMKARCSCALYLHRGYSADIHIQPLREDGYTHYFFRYDDFDIYTRYSKDGGKATAIDANNRINGRLTPEDVYLSHCAEIVPDPHARAAEIISEFAELRRKQDEFKREITRFNNLLPSGIERRSISGMKEYL